jgi:hypothetical protein
MVISGTHLSESKSCLRAVVSLSVRSSTKMVDTFGEASSAFRTSPEGTGVNDDTGANVSAGRDRSHGTMVSCRARGAFTPEGHSHPRPGFPRHCALGAIKRHSRVTQGSLKGHSRVTQGSLKGQLVTHETRPEGYARHQSTTHRSDASRATSWRRAHGR